jgi:hypothetical protein
MMEASTLCIAANPEWGIVTGGFVQCNEHHHCLQPVRVRPVWGTYRWAKLRLRVNAAMSGLAVDLKGPR